MEIDRDEILKTLNGIVELELAGVVRFTQYSLMVFGHARIPIMGWMREQAQQSLAHAIQAGEEVTALGGNVSLQHGRFVSANSRGFVGGHAHSYHSIAVAPIASRPRDGMQRDEWYVSRRDPTDLPSPESVGRYAAAE